MCACFTLPWTALLIQGLEQSPARIRQFRRRRNPKPDFDLRVQLLDTFTALITDQRLRDHVEHARDELLTRWVQAEPAAQ